MARAKSNAAVLVRSALESLAALYGIQTTHEDGLGRRCVAGDDTLLALLRSLGAQLDKVSPETLHAACLSRRIALWSEPTEPVAVLRAGAPAGIDLRLSDDVCSGPLSLRITLESGEQLRSDARIENLTTLDSATLDGQRYRRLRAPVGAALPAGYHEAVLGFGERVERVRIIAAPARAHLPEGLHTWGAFLPLYALRADPPRGCADLGDLRRLVEWVGGLGGGAVGTLPLSAAFLDRPFDASPYTPVSRLFWNELYLDLTRTPELHDCRDAQRTLQSPHYRQEESRLAALRTVDHRAQAALRRPVVAALAERFFEAPEDPDFARYVDAHPRSLDYARFRATAEARREVWHAWPERSWSGRLLPADWDERAFRYHLWAQWRMDQQLAEVASVAADCGAGLYLDLPLGVHPDGYDAWRDRQSFLAGCTAGAPPDALFEGGQNWGFHPRNPDGERSKGYRYFAECLDRLMSHAGILRIDHVMGLHRLYCIPEGMGARDGAYVTQRADELYAVLTLESSRHEALTVGEDLGTVPPEVRDTMEGRGLLRMHVAQFAIDPDASTVLLPAPRNTLASINTHDLPTFDSFWHGRDIDLRVEMGLTPPQRGEVEKARRRRACDALARSLDTPQHPAPVLRAMLLALARSESPVLMLNLEDLWLEPEPQNVPGTGAELPNWKRKARLTIEQMAHTKELTSLLSEITRVRSEPSE